MWILPKNLTSHTFHSASAMVESTSDSTEFSETDYDSPLFARSKPLLWKMLCRKWKQDSFLRLRSGLIYGHSLGKNFKMSRWYQEVFPASHSLLPESGKEIKTQDTSSPSSLMESNDADRDLFSWKMSKESFQASLLEKAGQTQQEHRFCSMSLENWSVWVTRQRQEYLARAKQARPTSAKESLSWPTARSRDWKDSGDLSQTSYGMTLPRMAQQEEQNWVTPTTIQIQRQDMQKRIDYRASVGRKYVPGSLEEQMQHHGQIPPENWATPSTMYGAMYPETNADKRNSPSLASQAAMWPTPTTAEAGKISNQPNHGQTGLSNHPAIVGECNREKYEKSRHGLPAPENSNTHGNHQGSSEQSQKNWQTFAPGTHNRGETPHRQVVRALVNGEKAQTQCLTVDQVFAEEIKGTNKQHWPTPTMQDGKQGGITPSQAVKGAGHTGLLHIAAIKSQQDWRTPSSSDGEGGIMEMREGCAGKYKLRDHVAAVEKQDWRTPTVAEEKNQNTSKQVYLQNQVGATPKQWATPRSGKTTDENPETWAKRQANGDVATMPLTVQVKQWATPQASDHIEGRRTDLDSNQKCLGRDMKTWATPNAFDWNTAENTQAWEKRAEKQKEAGVNLHLPLKSQTIHEKEKQVGTLNPNTAKLNPRWVEMLMNLPLGWTSPNCPASVILNWPKFVSGCLRLNPAQTNSDCSEMVLSDQRQQELF